MSTSLAGIETPNTRGRRKRELESSTSNSQEEGGRIVWAHDQGLRRAVMMAVQHIEVPPPTPTQKPRPISTRISQSSPSIASARASSSTLTETTSGSTSRPRKRPYRGSRSLPHSSAVSTDPNRGAFASLRGTSSAPFCPIGANAGSGSADGDTQLGELLLQWDLFQASEGAKGSSSSSASASALLGKDQSVRNGNSSHADSKDTMGRKIEQGSGQRTTVTRNEPVVLRSVNSVNQPERSGRSTSTTSVGDKTDIKDKVTPSNRPKQNTRQEHHAPLSHPTPPSVSASPTKSQGVPRIGIGIASSNSRSGSYSYPNSRAFKPPTFVGPHPQATRSSPRRANANANANAIGRAQPYAIPPSPLRGPEMPAKHAQGPGTRSINRVSTTTNTAMTTPAGKSGSRGPAQSRGKLPVKTPARPLHNANVDIGEDEPEGETSFDSFDGMFQEGGAEIEELLRKVDGSQ